MYKYTVQAGLSLKPDPSLAETFGANWIFTYFHGQLRIFL